MHTFSLGPTGGDHHPTYDRFPTEKADNRRNAAIYINGACLLPAERPAAVAYAYGLCQRYCEQQGYLVHPQHIYIGEDRPIWSDAPSMIALRMAAFENHFHRLVIPSLRSIGYVTPWIDDPSYRTINGHYISVDYSNRIYHLIQACFQHHVLVEGVITPSGYHNALQDIVYEALQFAHMLRYVRKQKG